MPSRKRLEIEVAGIIEHVATHDLIQQIVAWLGLVGTSADILPIHLPPIGVI